MPVSRALGDAMSFLDDLTRAVVESSRVAPGQSVAGSPPNATGGTLIRPGGRACYPAFWIRDFAMSLGSGLTTAAELEHALLLTARLQAPVDWHTPGGSLVPRGAIADHITFDGKPIFFPGTYDYARQGQPWGYLPSLDDHYYFVEMAWQLAVSTGQASILARMVDGVRLIDRLALAFDVPPLDSTTGLVVCDEAHRGVSFGFTDVVVHTGKLLFCSLLRFRAAQQLVQLFGLCGEPDRAEAYREVATQIRAHLASAFAHSSGLLRASTGLSTQPDVWGSAYAVYIGALDPDLSLSVSSALLKAYHAGTISWRGNIRHVPADWDYNATTSWERTVGHIQKNHYQNGAYWGTPVGWVCDALAQVDVSAAQTLVLDYVAELQTGDFRQGDAWGSPYECIHPGGDYHQNPVYMASVACPMEAFRRLGWIR